MKKISKFYNTLLSQHYTEKANFLLNKFNCFTFIVSKSSNKSEIKNVVEKLFNVSVAFVRIVVVKGKSVKFKNCFGKKSDFKKALVYLNKGNAINFAEFK
jgi:large subunit ribosomal protein L23